LTAFFSPFTDLTSITVFVGGGSGSRSQNALGFRFGTVVDSEHDITRSRLESRRAAIPRHTREGFGIIPDQDFLGMIASRLSQKLK
jgi:hypothetical protein